MSKEDRFPSSIENDEDMSSLSSASHNQAKKSKRPQRSRKDDESNYDEDGSEDLGTQGRNRNKKTPFGIQGKVISRKKTQDSKFKKTTAANPTATFLYKPGALLPCLSPYMNSTIAIRISKEYINKNNPSIINRAVWGSNGVYSSHSDAVAMGIHHGALSLTDIKLTAEFYEGVILYCKVVKGKRTINGSFKHPILSRSLKTLCPHCLKPERTQWLQTLGTPEQLASWARKMAQPENRRLTKKTYMSLYSYDQAPVHKPTVTEVLINKLLPPLNEGWIVFDMCNEPSQKYNVITFMDRQTQLGFKSNTSYKLRSHVLFIENKRSRYEISMDESIRQDDVFLEPAIYSIAELNDPLRVDLEYMKNVGLPLPSNVKKEKYSQLRWSEFQWSQTSVQVRDLKIEDLTCFKLIPIPIKQ